MKVIYHTSYNESYCLYHAEREVRSKNLLQISVMYYCVISEDVTLPSGEL